MKLSGMYATGGENASLARPTTRHVVSAGPMRSTTVSPTRSFDSLPAKCVVDDDRIRVSRRQISAFDNFQIQELRIRRQCDNAEAINVRPTTVQTDVFALA